MKQAPLTIKIPCILDMIISGILVGAVLVFLGTGRFPSTPELIMFVILAINGTAAYKCMQGNFAARNVLIGLKFVLVLFMPVSLLIAILWGYLLIWPAGSKEFFSKTV
jgi:hypothetical protein